jgi:glyoxylase-like metal-dependent hydrolase (beta-lactamase superfamily II)
MRGHGPGQQQTRRVNRRRGDRGRHQPGRLWAARGRCQLDGGQAAIGSAGRLASHGHWNSGHIAPCPKSSAWTIGTTISRALPTGGIPSAVFASEHSLKLDGLTIALKHYGPAHSESDISVTFAEANVVHVADTFWNGIYPFIDYSTGGSIDGMIAASDANLAAASDDTIIIAGHGKAVGTKAELREFRDMLVAVREKVGALKKQGRSRDEIVAAKPTAAFDAKFGNFVTDPAFLHEAGLRGRLRGTVISIPLISRMAGDMKAIHSTDTTIARGHFLRFHHACEAI